MSEATATKGSTSRGILSRGSGNHLNVTVARIRPQEAGIDVSEEATSIVKLAAKSADVRFSAGATAAWHSMTSQLGKTIADEVAGAATEWATARGSKRVWDIDMACAAGYDRTIEGAAEFRKAFGLRAPSTPWPSKVSETPQADTPKGTVINLETGKQK